MKQVDPHHPLIRLLTKNPISLIFYNTYSFFYWFPRKKVLYDHPWTLFRNSTVEWLAWYQLPHTLPPYRYLDSGYPDDFFCYGLPGNTLPLGNWDPFCFSQVQRSVVRKYRESEVKHGRIAMLACVGYLLQEAWHPLYPHIGGMAMTHMEQLRDLSCQDSALCRLADQAWAMDGLATWPVDYYLLVTSFMLVEVKSFLKNWTRWKASDYKHQYVSNIGLGNLKEDYEVGDLHFDPLKLMPDEEEDRKWITEVELNHGRLAMVGFVGMLGQEYLTGQPVASTLYGGQVLAGLLGILAIPFGAFGGIGEIFQTVQTKLSSSTF
eukprot:scaffold521_cov177-Ochromonas_danica.AAC.9